MSARTAPQVLDLCDPTTALTVARRAGVRLQRRLGQHLLTDRTVLRDIVDALQPTSADEVWEVGAGIGTLTRELAARAKRVVAVELDPNCVRALASTVGGLENVTVVAGDALRADADSLGLADDHLVTGNLPYQITGALLRHLLEARRPPRRIVVVVQREVAARLAAPEGHWSLATVAVRSVATVERLRDIPPSAFVPPPRVHSSILRLHPTAVVDAEERLAVLHLARCAFQLRRKVLRHGLTRALGSTELATSVIEDTGIEPSRRPGTLDLDEWRALAASARHFGWSP